MKKHLLTVPMILVMTLVSGCYSTAQQSRCASGFCSEDADVVEIQTETTQSVYVEETPSLVREDIAVSKVKQTPCTAPVDLKSGQAACGAAPAPVAAKPAPAVQPLVIPAKPQATDAKDVPEDVLVEPMVVKQLPTSCQGKSECFCSKTTGTSRRQ